MYLAAGRAKISEVLPFPLIPERASRRGADLGAWRRDGPISLPQTLEVSVWGLQVLVEGEIVPVGGC